MVITFIRVCGDAVKEFCDSQDQVQSFSIFRTFYNKNIKVNAVFPHKYIAAALEVARRTFVRHMCVTILHTRILARNGEIYP
jgi:hypothetical protein